MMCPKLVFSCLILYFILTYVDTSENPDSSQSGTSEPPKKGRGKPTKYPRVSDEVELIENSDKIERRKFAPGRPTKYPRVSDEVENIENSDKIDRRKFAPGRPTQYPLTGDYKDLSLRPIGRPTKYPVKGNYKDFSRRPLGRPRLFGPSATESSQCRPLAIDLQETSSVLHSADPMESEKSKTANFAMDKGKGQSSLRSRIRSRRESTLDFDGTKAEIKKKTKKPKDYLRRWCQTDGNPSTTVGESSSLNQEESSDQLAFEPDWLTLGGAFNSNQNKPTPPGAD